VSNRAIVLIVALLASCAGPQKTAQKPQATAEPPHAQIVAPEFGRRPPNTRISSDNMPFFDTVRYCLASTRQIDRIPKGPAYEACIEHQDHTRSVMAEAIDAGKFKDDDIIRCAKASPTAYHGMWYCLNNESY